MCTANILRLRKSSTTTTKIIFWETLSRARLWGECIKKQHDLHVIKLAVLFSDLHYSWRPPWANTPPNQRQLCSARRHLVNALDGFHLAQLRAISGRNRRHKGIPARWHLTRLKPMFALWLWLWLCDLFNLPMSAHIKSGTCENCNGVP